MNRLIQTFLENLTNRITALIGSAIGSTAATFRATHHAEQMAQLEDLARKYEGEGKLEIAQTLRQQASRMEVDDPGSDARTVMDNLLENQEPTALENKQPNSCCESLPAPTPRRRRKRQTPEVKDDSED